MSAGSVKKVESSDRFKGGFFQELSAAVARYGEKLEAWRGRGRNEQATHSHYPWKYFALAHVSQDQAARYGFNLVRRGAYVWSFRTMAA